MVGRVNERMVQRAMEQSTPTSESDHPPDPQGARLERDEVKATSCSEILMEEQPEVDHQTPPEVNNQEQLEAENQGKLIVDATCAPVDIHYPTDLGLLNSAREHTEAIIDVIGILVTHYNFQVSKLLSLYHPTYHSPQIF